MKKIKTFVVSALGRRRKNVFILDIGYFEEALVPGKRTRYNWTNSGLRVESYSAFFWKAAHGKLRLRPDIEPNPHVVIVGMSGYGKSTMLRGMIDDIRGGNRAAIVFDAHNEHEDAVRSVGGTVHDARYSGINIFELSGVSVAERMAQLTSLFKGVYALGYIQALKLSECMWYTYRKAGAETRDATVIGKAPTIRDLIAELNVFIMNARTSGEKNTLLHLKGRLSLLNTTTFTRNFVGVDELMSGVHSFSLAGLGNGEAQLIYIHEVLKRLYSGMKKNEKERGLKLYIIIDEAQFLINGSESDATIIRKMIEEGRKYGVGVIIATHMASRLEKQITANANLFMTFRAQEPSEVNYLAGLFSGGDVRKGEAVRQRLGTLKQNKAMVISSRIRLPAIVSTKRNANGAVPVLMYEHEVKRTREVPPDVKMAVWERDCGKCVKCGNCTDLHFDHIIPYSKGGSSTDPKNIQILCSKCNLSKRDRIE